MNILEREADPGRVNVVQHYAEATRRNPGQVDVSLDPLSHGVGEHGPEVVRTGGQNSPVCLESKKIKLPEKPLSPSGCENDLLALDSGFLSH